MPTLHSLGIWSLGIVCSWLSTDLELRDCPPWTQLFGNALSCVGLLLWVLPHPCIPTRTGESGKHPKRRRFHPGMALPGHAQAKLMEVFCLSEDFRGPAMIPLRSLQSVPLWSDPRSRILVSRICLWDPPLSFPAPSFASCVASDRASAGLLPANPVEETSLGIGVLGKVQLQLVENSCSWLIGIMFQIDP